MGCDIHAHIDYDDFMTTEGKMWVSCFCQSLDFGRNYTLFTLMAGVRHDPRTDRYGPLFEARGLPDRASFAVCRKHCLRVADKQADEEGCCSAKDAEGWVAEGYSRWANDEHTKVTNPDWHTPSWLTAEDLEKVKTAYESIEFPERSWFQMRPPEEQSIPEGSVATELDCQHGKEWYVEIGEKKTYPAPRTFNAIIAAMRTLDGDQPGRSRLVFWFDN